MSRVFNNKNKDLVNLDVVSSKEVWEKQKNGKYLLSKDYDIFGRIERGTSVFVTKTNRRGENPKFVEDTHFLTNRTKNEIVKRFQNKKTSVLYLVKKK